MATSTDVSSSLYWQIRGTISERINKDSKIQSILKKVDKGTATHVDTEKVAERIGEISSDVMKSVLTPENLPDGTLYYNIAEKTIGRTLRDNQAMVNQLGARVQNGLNKKAGIGLKSVDAKLNANRVDDLVNAIANCEEFDRSKELMTEPIVNTTQSFADDYVEANADFQYNAGLHPTITRTANAGCCDWCRDLAGTYEYPLKDRSVYQRHENCGCVVTYDPGDGRNAYQNVHTKKWTTDPQLVEERKKIGLRK